MFLYEKKILYMALYCREEKVGQVGFARISGEKGQLVITLRVKGLQSYHREGAFDGKYPLYLWAGERVFLGSVELTGGEGYFERSFTVRQDSILTGNRELPLEKITGLWMLLDRQDGYRIAGGEIGKAADGAEGEPSPQRKQPEDNRQADRTDRTEDALQAKSEMRTAQLIGEWEKEQKFQETYSGDKWEELLKQFPQVHPFGDERVFISIEPRDFVILQENYQKLVNNSFLLHGFYNYRHLILGRDEQLGEREKNGFYLGVPGVFFEREKMVAIMFGFEGFASEGAVETGKFGYYMRRVEL